MLRIVTRSLRAVDPAQPRSIMKELIGCNMRQIAAWVIPAVPRHRALGISDRHVPE
jgi:hypothetical protein